jgi:hypothetical protein
MIDYKLSPNPFKSSLRLQFQIYSSGSITIDLYNIMGQKIQSLFESELLPGHYDQVFELDDLSPGMYTITLSKAGRVFSEKIIKY